MRADIDMKARELDSQMLALWPQHVLRKGFLSRTAFQKTQIKNQYIQKATPSRLLSANVDVISIETLSSCGKSWPKAARL